MALGNQSSSNVTTLIPSAIFYCYKKELTIY